jgi:hypothetical protein
VTTTAGGVAGVWEVSGAGGGGDGGAGGWATATVATAARMAKVRAPSTGSPRSGWLRLAGKDGGVKARPAALSTAATVVTTAGSGGSADPAGVSNAVAVMSTDPAVLTTAGVVNVAAESVE